MGGKMNKHSQVTIFIIIAMIIIAGIALFFLMLAKQKPAENEPSVQDPSPYIEKCARDSALEAIERMLPQGGYLEPENYKLYQDDKIQYLCYTNLFYTPCINQEPLYIQHLEGEIKSYIAPKIEECFSRLKAEFEANDYTIDMKATDLTVSLAKNLVRIRIDKEISYSRRGESRRIERFDSNFASPLYNLAIVAQEIASQEAKFCSFEYLGYMLLYPDYNIDKVSIGEGVSASKIYTIEDRYSGKKLNIAIRSCAIPPGF